MVSAFQGSWILMCSDFPLQNPWKWWECTEFYDSSDNLIWRFLQTILFEGFFRNLIWKWRSKDMISYIFQTYLVFDHCLLKTKPIKLKLVFQRLWSNRWRQYTFVHISCRCLRPCIYESGSHWRIYVRSTWICTLWKNNYALIFGPSLPHSLDPSHCVHWRTHPPNSW